MDDKDKLPNADLMHRWVHSHEEDNMEGRVFRPEDFPFPPSRGRGSISIFPDGVVTRLGVGPDDRPTTSGDILGHWHAENKDNLRIVTENNEILELKQVAPDKIIIRGD